MIQMLSTYLESYAKRVRRDEDGQGLVEYALIIALVSVVLIAALGTLGGSIEGTFDDIADSLTGAAGS